MSAALAGVLVADFSRVLAGPYATMLLADLGARVIKVERPGSGDDTRFWGPPWAPDGQSTYFHAVNRNKESVALDLTNEADLRIAVNLAQRADILVENFKPGTMDRFGLTYETLRAGNPQLIWCSITGFGSKQGRDLPGYDLLAQAMGGLMSITGTHEPTKAGVAVVDVLTGLHATVAILAALHHREQTGQGQLIEVSLLGTLLSALVNQASAYVQAGVIAGHMGNAHPSIVPYDVYLAADRPLIIAVGNDHQFTALVSALGQPELAKDPRFATNASRVANREVLNRSLNSTLATESADHWQAVLTEAGIPVGPVNDIKQAFEVATRLGLSPMVPILDTSHSGHVTVAHPAQFSHTPAHYVRNPPTLDADGLRLRSEFGPES